jgi:hypothetical protein
VEISSVIEVGEAGEEACEDMVFIYVSLCLRKNMYLTAVTGKAGLWIKKYFGFSAWREMIDFFVLIHNAFAQYIYAIKM